jgi:hypothetical protein
MEDNLSVGILYSCQEFLRYVQEERLAAHDLTKYFDDFYVAKSQHVLNLCQLCRWIIVAQDGFIEITLTGITISAKNPQYALRDQIQDYILSTRPPWSGLLPSGREEAIKFFSDDVYQCFDEAELLTSCDNDTVLWWDTLSYAARGRKEDTLARIGRKGEKFSLDYEAERTKINPMWMAIESNLAGFDLQSIVSKTDSSALFIEVKASEKSLEYAQIFITENEWRVARTIQNYVFHIWVDINKDAQLFVVETECVKRHVPQKKGQGIWQSLKVPVKALAQECGTTQYKKIEYFRSK